MVHYGDNIFEIGAETLKTLRLAQWPRERIEAVEKRIRDAGSYDEAVAVCGEYIPIGDHP